MRSSKLLLSLFIAINLFKIDYAFAGDGATILFREGHVAYIANGYEALATEYKKLNTKEKDHSIIELKLESSPFLINISEIVIICRDRCTSLEVTDPRKSEPRR